MFWRTKYYSYNLLLKFNLYNLIIKPLLCLPSTVYIFVYNFVLVASASFSPQLICWMVVNIHFIIDIKLNLKEIMIATYSYTLVYYKVLDFNSSVIVWLTKPTNTKHTNTHISLCKVKAARFIFICF